MLPGLAAVARLLRAACRRVNAPVVFLCFYFAARLSCRSRAACRVPCKRSFTSLKPCFPHIEAETKWRTLYRRYFQMDFLERKLYFDWNFIEVCSLGSNQQYYSIGSGFVTCQATSHYLNQWWPSLLMHICITRLQWVDGFNTIPVSHNMTHGTV